MAGVVRRCGAAAVIALVAATAACTPTGGAGGGTTTTTTSGGPPTGLIVGVTENRACGGPVSPDGCQSDYVAVSDRVQVVPHIPAVDPFVITSGRDGSFSVRLIAGEWRLSAMPISPGGGTDCPAVTVQVVAGATQHVTLRCTIELP
jgi:hypothetical protein